MPVPQYKDHCGLKKLDPYGKCIACCWHNAQNLYYADCAGYEGKQPSDAEAGREIPIGKTLKLKG